MEQAGRTIRWRMLYSKKAKEVWLERGEAQYHDPDETSYYPVFFTQAEWKLLVFLYHELYDRSWIKGNGHQWKKIQKKLGDIVYNKMGERNETEGADI